MIRGDRGRLLQALANLIDNAVKYTPAGGRVDVAARAAAPGVEIAVRDTGIGIDRDDLPRIFERLYRADRSRSERGLGIGLSLVRAIVAAHGGSVEVESALGRGSVFRLRLPADGASAVPAQPSR
jgi:signal transduction histidine kinase